MYPSFASEKLPSIKALACQTAMVGGGAAFDLYFRKPEGFHTSHLVSLPRHKGYFLRSEGFYYPCELERMPTGWERYESFLAFQAELQAFLFPYFVKAFPLAESLGEKRFLSSVLPWQEDGKPLPKYESKSLWLALPDRKSAEESLSMVPA